MKILITGNYNSQNERTKNIISGLKQSGVKTILLPYRSLKIDIAKRISMLSTTVDAVFLPGFTHKNVKQVKKISSAPVLFNPEISRFLTKVYDEKEVIPYTPRAITNYYKDYKAFKYADIIFTETKQYKHYFMQKMGVKASKITVMPFCIDPTEYYSKRVAPDEFFRVTSIIDNAPLDSILQIIEAAKLMQGQNFRFDLIGIHPEQLKITKQLTDNNLRNINILNYESATELNELINYSSVCLGIFGNSKKSNLGVPAEIFKYAACGKPVITKDSMAIKEIFNPGRDIITTDDSPERIASMIRELKNDRDMNQVLGRMALKTIESKYCSRNSASVILRTIKRLKNTSR